MTWTFCNLHISHKHLINNYGDKQHIQNDIDKLIKWSEKWQMLFNFGKYKCLPTRHGNVDVDYKTGYTF